MRFDLATLTRRARNPRRSTITLRPIPRPATFATDLYRAAYAPVIDEWGGISERVIRAYGAALAGITTDSAEDVGRVLDESDGALLRLFLTLRPELERWALRLERWHRGRWRGAILSATGVDVGTLLGPADMRQPISAAIERNVALVRNISDQARGRIADSVFRGLNLRRPAREVAAEIREATGMARARALRIASDQHVKIASALDEERRREAGIDQWEWLHSGKRHPREEHVARNGKVYSDRDPPPSRPGEEPFCGCTSRAVLTFD